MRKLIGWGKWAVLAAVFPLIGQACAARRRAIEKEANTLAEGLSLREIVARKIHHGPGYFVNPLSDLDHGRFGELLKWKFFSGNEFKKDYDQEPVRPVRIDWAAVRAFQGPSVTFLRHAGLLIRDQGTGLLVDPVFDGIFSFIKNFAPREFDLAEMPRPDHVLITHGHYDHLDTASLGALDPDTHVITPLGYDEVFDGLNMTHRTKLDWFESYRADGWEITLVPCNHWTMRSPIRGRNRFLWGSYVVKTPGGLSIFVSGDAAWMNGYQELGEMFPVDLAVFNLGAYEPRWFMRKSHMNPEEVVRSFLHLGAKKLMIVHWGTFRLGNEPVHFPPRDLRARVEKEGLSDRLVDLDLGQTLVFDGPDPVGVI